MNVIKLLPLVWGFIWIPLSFIFPQHSHFPFPLVSPLLGFWMLLDNADLVCGLLEMNCWIWESVMMPFFIFWGMLLFFLIVGYLLSKKSVKSNK